MSSEIGSAYGGPWERVWSEEGDLHPPKVPRRGARLLAARSRSTWAVFLQLAGHESGASSDCPAESRQSWGMIVNKLGNSSFPRKPVLPKNTLYHLVRIRVGAN